MKQIKFIFMMICYIIAVVISCIITIPISWVMCGEKVYFNPFKLRWQYFDGEEYEFDTIGDKVITISYSSVLFCSIILLLFCLIASGLWIYILGITLFIYLTIKFVQFVRRWIEQK